jgi:hypothetical protein
MHPTSELLDAAADTLEQEARESDRSRRALLLVWTRSTLTQWRTGVLTTEQAVARLRAVSGASGSSFRDGAGDGDDALARAQGWPLQRQV